MWIELNIQVLARLRDSRIKLLLCPLGYNQVGKCQISFQNLFLKGDAKGRPLCSPCLADGMRELPFLSSPLNRFQGKLTPIVLPLLSFKQSPAQRLLHTHPASNLILWTVSGHRCLGLSQYSSICAVLSAIGRVSFLVE